MIFLYNVSHNWKLFLSLGAQMFSDNDSNANNNPNPRFVNQEYESLILIFM